MGCVVVILFTLFLVIGRFTIEPRLDLPTWEGTYETVAHLFVGGLFVKAWDWQVVTLPVKGRRMSITVPALILSVIVENRYFQVATGLSAFELVFFLIQKYC